VHLNQNEGAEQVVLHSLKSWAGFSRFAKTKLTQNRRALDGEEEFVKFVASLSRNVFRFLEEVGTGEKTKLTQGQMELPIEMVCGSEDEIIKWAFCNDNGTMKPFNEIEHTAILTPHNDTSLEINEKVLVILESFTLFKVLNMVEGAERIYESIDTPNETTGFQSIPPENLNSVKTLKHLIECPKEFFTNMTVCR